MMAGWGRRGGGDAPAPRPRPPRTPQPRRPDEAHHQQCGHVQGRPTPETGTAVAIDHAMLLHAPALFLDCPCAGSLTEIARVAARPTPPRCRIAPGCASSPVAGALVATARAWARRTASGWRPPSRVARGSTGGCGPLG